MIEQVNIETAVEPAPPSAGQTVAREKVRVRRRVRVHKGGVSHEPRGIFQPLPRWVWWVSLGLAALGAFTVNPVLTPFAILMLPVLGSLLWFKDEPPVLAFGCAMQWVQGAAAIFYTNYYGMSLKATHGGVELLQATWLTLISVLVLAIGMRLALVRRQKPALTQVEGEAMSLQPDRIFIWYLISFAAFAVIERVAYGIPGLRQPLLAATSLKWVLVFLLTYSVLVQQRFYALLGVTLCVEFATGLLGYFAGFKDVFFILLVILTSTQFLHQRGRLLQLGAVAALMVVFAVVWTAIKGDYREFLNQGSGQQEVVVSVDQRAEKLGELVSDVDSVALGEGLEQAIMRMSYVKFFALCLAHVPEVVPHEHGALWGGAITHVFMPRMFFPNKAAIDDSVQTTHYTGLEVAGAEEGTSISLGYVAQSYIDFGKWGMFAPILLLGLFYGAIYRFFLRGRNKTLGLAMATAILIFSASKVETSNVKLVGGNVMALIVIGLFAKFLGPTMWSWIAAPEAHRFIRRKRIVGKSKSWPGEVKQAEDFTGQELGPH